MAVKCLNCKGQASLKKFTFQYRNFKFSVLPRTKLYCKECRIREIKNSFDQLSKRSSNFVQLSKNGEVKVDWEFFLELKKMKDDSHSIDMLKILTYLGIMSDCYIKDGIIILGCDMVLNPHKFPFMRVQDAKEYAKLEFANAHYDWYIIKLDQVLWGYKILS